MFYELSNYTPSLWGVLTVDSEGLSQIKQMLSLYKESEDYSVGKLNEWIEVQIYNQSLLNELDLLQPLT